MIRSIVILIIVLFFGLALMYCSRTQSKWTDLDQLPIEKNNKKNSGMGMFDIEPSQSIIIDTNNLNHFPYRYIRVNFHFLNSKNKNQNFSEDSGKVFVYRLLNVMQILFDKNDKMRLPQNNDIAQLPPRLKYVLHASKNDDGIYFHYDDDLVYYNHMGYRSNNSDYTVVERYAIGIDSIINFFILPHHPDSVRSKSYQSGCVGIALGNAIKIAGIFEKGLNEWNVRGTFNHEVGHVLGLYHAWEDDGCDDTPRHANNCWADAVPGCAGKTSNNIMDYNAFQSAISPCQLQIIHSNLSNLNHQARKLLVPTWCKYDYSKKITIKEKIIWSTDRDLEGDIEIQNGGELLIKCRVSMSPGSKIIIHPKGKLILNNCIVHNACGQKWRGIEVLRMHKKSGTIIKYEHAKINDVEGSKGLD